LKLSVSASGLLVAAKGATMTQEPAGSDSAALKSDAAALNLKKKRKKDRLRSAWISFTGRIVAQLVGAVATVTLGVLVLHHAQAGRYETPNDVPLAEPASATPSSTVERTPDHAIAVLSFLNYSGDQRQDAFADALTEALITRLSQADGLRVVSRTSSTQYKSQPRPLPEIARALGATYVIEGSVVKTDRRLRVVAQLIDARTDRHVWAQTYDRSAGDPLALQADLATRIAGDVRTALNPKRQPRALAGGPAEPAVSRPATVAVPLP
jgi:TolB-like protein